MLNEIRIGGKKIRTGDYLNSKWKAVRKLPVIVGAIQMPEDFEVDTLEGTHSAKAGDYLLKGVRGELYPVKKDIFEETYEFVHVPDTHENELR